MELQCNLKTYTICYYIGVEIISRLNLRLTRPIKKKNIEFGHKLEHLINSFDADNYENDDDGDNADIQFEGRDSFLWSSE